MANRQNIDLMGGFRKSLPFTSAMLHRRRPGAGGLPAHLRLFLQGRDPRLRRLPRRPLRELHDRRLHRRPVDRLLRLPDRVPGRVRTAKRGGARPGAGCPPARRARRTPRPARSRTSTSATPAQTTTVAEGEKPMKIRDEHLALVAIFAGLVQIPGVDDVVERFLTASSSIRTSTSSDRARPRRRTRGLLVGGLISVARDRARLLTSTSRNPGLAGGPAASAFAAVHDFLEQQVVLRRGDRPALRPPALAVGRCGQPHLRARTWSTGWSSARPTWSAAPAPVVRGAQSGYLRSYALLLVSGFAGLGLYFLLRAHEELA